MKYLVVVAFIAILASLASALFFMMRNGRDDKAKGSHMAKALALRVGFSIVLFLRFSVICNKVQTENQQNLLYYSYL